jgi:predicted amidohydrolase
MAEVWPVGSRQTMRVIKVAAAQLGPVQRAETRQAVVARMLALLQQAAAKGCDLVVYP